MLQIYILRHGAAEPIRQTDAERVLTPQGEKEAAAAARHLLLDMVERENNRIQQSGNMPVNASIGALPVDIQIVTSPYKRAMQTATILSDIIGYDHELLVLDDLTPDATPRQSLAALAATVDKTHCTSLLVVSHLPLVGLLLNGLTRAEFKDNMAIGTGHLIKIESDYLALGHGKHIWTKTSA